MFYGRKNELEQLREQFDSYDKAAVLVYGKRRIGKSTLIREAAKSFSGTVIYHLCVESTFKGNLDLLARSVTQALTLPSMRFDTLFDLFDFLKTHEKPLLLVIDEYQYFKSSLRGKELDSTFQAIIDTLPKNIKLVLCGSYVTMMRELLEQDNPLFGRFTSIIHLKEMDYLDAQLFYPDRSVRDKIALYSIFGGSPFVLSQLTGRSSVETSIKKLLLPDNSILRSHIENVALSEIRKSFDVRILEYLDNGKKKYSEIASFIGADKNGLLDKQLKHLISMETICKDSPINKRGDRRKQFYSISDNLMRFYFTYIFANEESAIRLGEDSFFKQRIGRTLETFVSLRFESIALQYFERLARQGRLPDVTDMGSYWYDDKAKHANGQFGCALKRSDGYEIFEVKYYKKPMSRNECMAEIDQVQRIEDLHVTGVGFVCSAGFDFEAEDLQLISGDDLFAEAATRRGTPL